jgi:hypothetical protein
MPMANADEDIEELRQVQLNSLRRLAERLQNELDEVRNDRKGRLAQSGPPSRRDGCARLAG